MDDLKQCPLLHTPEYARKADRLLVNITGGADLSLTKVNELMSALTEEFGREAHVVMGAAIDEALQGRVEICVIGTTDLGSRNFVRRPAPAAPVKKSERTTAPTATSLAPEANKNFQTAVTPVVQKPATTGTTTGVHANKPQQEEFGFGASAPAENRGAFDKSDRNLFEGQDLDVPTYLRKGIKVTV